MDYMAMVITCHVNIMFTATLGQREPNTETMSIYRSTTQPLHLVELFPPLSQTTTFATLFQLRKRNNGIIYGIINGIIYGMAHVLG